MSNCIRPAGRRGACSCGNQYAQILDRLDTVEQEASDAKTTAQTAANSASIQAANAAADATQAASDAGDALTQATAAAASAAAAALDAADAAADLASINSTISSTLATYLGAKVDKLTTTGSFAYTHTNATQGETALVNGTTSNTIPIRDANGRMQAADPASGATDKTLTTANWVSQAGSGAPNNLLHTNGNEEGSGIKAIWPAYYNGAFPSSPNKTQFIDFGRIFSAESFGNVTLSLNGRADYFFGVITGSQNGGVISSSYVGVYSNTSKVSIGFAEFSDGIHLLMCRTTAAGQGFSVQIFGIGNVTSSPPVTPSLTYNTVTINAVDYHEVILI